MERISSSTEPGSCRGDSKRFSTASGQAIEKLDTLELEMSSYEADLRDQLEAMSIASGPDDEKLLEAKGALAQMNGTLEKVKQLRYFAVSLSDRLSLLDSFSS